MNCYMPYDCQYCPHCQGAMPADPHQQNDPSQYDPYYTNDMPPSPPAPPSAPAPPILPGQRFTEGFKIEAILTDCPPSSDPQDGKRFLSKFATELGLAYTAVRLALSRTSH